MAGGFRSTWEGGRIYWRDLGDDVPAKGKRGRKRSTKIDHRVKHNTGVSDELTGKERGPTYYVWRSVGGEKYQISTRCSTRPAAMKELYRFEADPAKYKPGGEIPEPSASPIYLTVHPPENGPELDPKYLIDCYLLWCREVKENSSAWRAQSKQYLGWWSEQLKGIDLRKVSLREHIEPALGPELKPGQEGYSTRGKRIAVIKALYSYMRKEQHSRDHGFEVSSEEDPVFGKLRVPPSVPGKRKMKNKAVSKEHILLAIEHLIGHWKAALQVQAGTGWHVTETVRFARSGTIESYPRSGPDKEIAGVLVCPESKGGGAIRTGVTHDVLEAAKVLLKNGGLKRVKYVEAIASACGAAEIPVFTPGRMRHSVATHAVDAGADLQSLSTFLHHKSPATTRKFYATHGIAKRPPTLM